MYSIKEKDIAALPSFFDKFADCGDDWKGDVERFGKEDKDDYLRFEYFGKEVMKKSNTNGGILLTNRNCDGSRHRITVRVKRMLIDLLDSKIEREEASTLPGSGVFPEVINNRTKILAITYDIDKHTHTKHMLTHTQVDQFVYLNYTLRYHFITLLFLLLLILILEQLAVVSIVNFLTATMMIKKKTQ